MAGTGTPSGMIEVAAPAWFCWSKPAPGTFGIFRGRASQLDPGAKSAGKPVLKRKG